MFVSCRFLTAAIVITLVGAAVLAPAAPAGPVVADLPASTTPAMPVTVQKDITFAMVDGEKIQLDLAMPKGPGPYPCVVLFHGGAWRYGSRKDLSTPNRDSKGNPTPSVIEMVAARGFVAVTASYRLSPKSKFPAQIEDARTAIRFLRANAKSYHLDPDRIGAVGFSAGAHLSLLLGLADKSQELDGTLYPEQDGRVQCVVSFFGPTDLSLYSETPGIQEAYMVPFLGKACKTDPNVYKRASPINYVSKDDPPVMLIHGTLDVVVPIIHSERLYKKLQDTGVTAELITVPGEGHGWNGPVLTRTVESALKFLETHLKDKK